jgi:hypothetical protein
MNSWLREVHMTHVITRGEWGRIIANAWLDATFAHELSRDPAKAVKNFLALDAKSEVIVFEIPAKPGDLVDSQLEDVRSGRTTGIVIPYFCCSC